jgi:hypothetical protein
VKLFSYLLDLVSELASASAIAYTMYMRCKISKPNSEVTTTILSYSRNAIVHAMPPSNSAHREIIANPFCVTLSSLLTPPSEWLPGLRHEIHTQLISGTKNMPFSGVTVRDQVISACRGVPECNLALYKPADTFEGVCAEPGMKRTPVFCESGIN